MKTAAQFGLSSDKITSADYGDGKAEIAVYRAGTWYLLQSTNGFVISQWGLSIDVPAPADYDGDGKDDLAVYRARTWWIMRSTAGLLVAQFGLSSDMPVANRYLP